jgi:hypothetical protein
MTTLSQANRTKATLGSMEDNMDNELTHELEDLLIELKKQLDQFNLKLQDKLKVRKPAEMEFKDAVRK